MSQFDKRSSRRQDPSISRHEDDVLLSDVATESTVDVGNTDFTSALLSGPEDAFHGLAAGTASLAAQGIDVSPVMTSLALRRRAMLRADIASDTSSVDRVMTRSGSALPNALRSRMEASFQHMFGHVRVHTDAAAEQAAKDLNAHAFAVGSHIYFGAGTWRPGSTETDRLLAHELTHVVQHDEGRIHGSGVSSPTDPLEREAYANEDRIVSQLSEMSQTPEPDSGTGWMDASLALGPVPLAVENARDGGGHAQDAAGEALNEQAASLGASAFGMGGMVLRDEDGDGPGGQSKPQEFAVGDEVYARAGENARRGVVSEVREWAEGDGGVTVAPSDGWTYVVTFERDEGTTTGNFVIENVRKAEVQDVPDASVAEASGDELVEAEVCEPEEETTGAEETGEEVATEVGPQADGENTTTEAPTADSVELPSLGPVLQPTLQTSSPVSLGPVAPVVVSASIPEAPELNATHQRVVQSLNTRLGESQTSFNTAASQVENLCLDSSSSFGLSETDLRTQFVSTNVQSLQSVGTDVDGVLTETDAAFTSFNLSLDQSATQLTSNLTVQAQETERALLQSQADFPLVIQRAVEAHKILMEAEFGTVITDITNQAAEEKAAAELAGRTYGGGPARADEVAGQIQKAKVKENYAKALRKFIDAVYEDLMAKGGMPADEWAQSLHAPALSAVWPGMQQHQELVDQKKNRDQAAATRARSTYSGMVSLERTTLNAQMMSHQDQVCEQQDEATEQLNQSVAQVTEDNAAVTEIVASGLEERQTEEREAIADAAPDQSTGVDASMWDLYVAKYEYRSNAEHQNVLAGMRAYNESGLIGVQALFSDMTTSMDAHADQEAQSVELQHSVFRQGVQQSATDQVQGLQTQASDVQAQHIETAANAQTQASEVLSGIEGAAATFLTTTVQPALEGYSASTRERMSTLLGKMEGALTGAAAAGAAKEKQDRQSRASKVWAAADYTWGTDEAKMMEGVSGTSPLQAHALCVEYQRQQGHSLSYIIQDETSGSLKESLLAWIFGDEVAAAKHAMDYGSESWFPDAGVLDPALRGVSDEGRRALNADPEWQAKSADDSLTTWYREGDSENALASLADMSLTKDEAELEADAALLFQTMDTISGTDEAGAYALLEKYGPEKSAELRAAYAEYSYDRLHGDGSFDALSAEDQQTRTDSTLTRDINGDFDSYYSEADNDRALALSQGNMGAARAAQLAQSANWSNDEKAALTAVSDANMYQGDDWLQGVEATENHAVFLQTMAEYDAGTNVTLADIQAGNTAQGRQTAVDGWDANEASTQNWIGDEFWGPNTAENMLRDKLLTGEADEGDMLMFGADTAGTREAWVTDALNQVKAQKDYYVRLDMLVNMGGRAATYIADMFPGPRQRATNGVSGMMSRLPSYLADLDPDKAASLTSAIRNILICLNAEADGGQQFDWELLLGESLRRDKNATDVYEMADQKFKNMLPESVRNKAANNSDLQAWLNETSATRLADINAQRERWKNGERESGEGQVTATDLMLAAHIIKLKQMYDAGKDVHFDGATGFLFAHAAPDQASLAEAWWTSFEAQCSRVDTANAFEEASQNQLAAALTMIVTAIAGVAIAIVSFGSASAASAALISAGITLAAGMVNIAINFAIKGDRYGMEDMLTDLAKTVTDAALQFATLGMSKMARLGPWLKTASAADDVFLKLAAAAVNSLPGELNGILFNENVWRGDNLDMALRQFFVGVAKGAVTGVTADYAKEGFSDITQSKGLAGMYLEAAIDEVTALAGDAVTNPAALQDPAYWINMTTKLGIGTAGGAIAQRRAVSLMNGRPFSDLTHEQLDRLHASALGELSEAHRAEIHRLAQTGNEDFVGLQNKLVNAARAVTAEVPPDHSSPETEVTVIPTTETPEDVDTEELPALNYTPLDEEVDESPTPINQSRVDDEDLPPLHTNEMDETTTPRVLDPESTVVEVPGSGTSTVRTPDDIDNEVVDRLDSYADGGLNASMVTDYVMEMDTPEQRLNAVNTLQEAFDLQTTMHVSEMGPSEMETLVQSHMLFDSAFQESDILRKVVPEAGMMGLWQDYRGNESRDPQVGGSVGPSTNTDNLTAPETVSALGLDYRNTNRKTGADEGPSPYVTETDGRYQAVDSLIYTDVPLTDAMRAAARIPVDDRIIQYALQHDDPAIRAFAEARYTKGQDTQEAPVDGLQESRNPFTGNGMTLPTSWLDNPTVVPNQEYTMGYTSMAPGTQWYGLDSEGKRVVLLTYNGPPDVAHAPYTRSDAIPPGSALEAQIDGILKRAYEATGQDPLRHYER